MLQSSSLHPLESFFFFFGGGEGMFLGGGVGWDGVFRVCVFRVFFRGGGGEREREREEEDHPSNRANFRHVGWLSHLQLTSHLITSHPPLPHRPYLQ